MSKESFDVEEPKKQVYRTFRFGVQPELDELLEKDRMSIPLQHRPNKSEHVRQILWNHVKRN